MINVDAFLNTLPMMLKGLAGIFIVILVVIIFVNLLNILFPADKNAKNK
jgi:hypothetical protein